MNPDNRYYDCADEQFANACKEIERLKEQLAAAQAEDESFLCPQIGHEEFFGLLRIDTCCRCGQEARTYDAGGDERMCLPCARKERAVLKERLQSAREELMEHEEQEASVCPEDVGFMEMYAILEKQLATALKERDEARRDWGACFSQAAEQDKELCSLTDELAASKLRTKRVMADLEEGAIRNYEAVHEIMRLRAQKMIVLGNGKTVICNAHEAGKNVEDEVLILEADEARPIDTPCDDYVGAAIDTDAKNLILRIVVRDHEAGQVLIRALQRVSGGGTALRSRDEGQLEKAAGVLDPGGCPHCGYGSAARYIQTSCAALLARAEKAEGALEAAKHVISCYTDEITFLRSQGNDPVPYELALELGFPRGLKYLHPGQKSPTASDPYDALDESEGCGIGRGAMKGRRFLDESKSKPLATKVCTHVTEHGGTCKSCKDKSSDNNEVDPEWRFTETLDLDSQRSNPRALGALRSAEDFARVREFIKLAKTEMEVKP